MTEFLLKLFIKDYKNTAARYKYGILGGAIGIFLNLLLFSLKLMAGIISSSIAIIADGFNNLSDAGSSIVVLLGFKMAGKPADIDHPFGHGRAEYLTGLVISIIIIFMGLELLRGSFKKILSPEAINLDTLSLIILVFAILIKLWMFFFYLNLSKRISSSAMKTAALDSRNDVIATGIVLFGVILSHAYNLNLDGYLGILVALFIFYSGIASAKENISPLLGQAPDKELVEKIQAMVLAHPEISGIHDLIIHNYGPGQSIISLHAEVPGDADFIEIHDTIDMIEMQLKESFYCEATIHMDPIFPDDEYTNSLKSSIYSAIIGQFATEPFAGEFSIHDFRLIKGPTHTNIIFDLVAPFDCPLCEAELIELVNTIIKELDESYFGIIRIDRPLT